MSNALRATWTDPVVGASQRPLALIDAQLAVAVVAPAVPSFTSVQHVLPGVGSYTFTNLTAGSYVVRLLAVDVDGVVGAPVDTAAALAFDAPGVVTGVTVVAA